MAGPIWLFTVLAAELRLQARLRQPLLVGVAALLVAERVAFHLYLGPLGFSVAIWATCAVLFYLRFRTVIPLIVEHVLYDGMSWSLRPALADDGFTHTAVLAGVLIGPAVIVLALQATSGRRRQDRSHGVASGEVGALELPSLTSLPTPEGQAPARR